MLEPLSYVGAEYDGLQQDGHECAALLDDALPGTFETSDQKVEITLWHHGVPSRAFSPAKYHNMADLRSALNATAQSRLRVLSIASAFSLDPLCITKPMAQELVRFLNIPPSFSEVVLSFGQPPTSEPGLSCYSASESPEGSYQVCYLQRFVERNDKTSPWKFRQFGVYQAYDKVNDSSFWVVLQPHPDSVFDERLDSIASQAEAVETLLRSPFRLHHVLNKTYLPNWRWYIRQIAERTQKDVRRGILVSYPLLTTN